MPYHTSRGVQLHYETVGEGRPVLLLHGFTSHGLAWTPQLFALAASGHRAVLPDLAGHGLSAPAASVTTVADLAADALALLDHLGLERAVTCGLSLGGMVAQQLAADAPGRVSALVLADSAARFDDAPSRRAAASWVKLLDGPDGPLRRLDAAWPILAVDDFRSGLRALYAAWRLALTGCSGASLANVARGMTAFDLRERLPRLAVPTLVLVGAEDALLPPDRSRELAALIPGARLAMLPAAGHLSNADRPDAFNQVLLEFLAATAGASGPTPAGG